MKSINQHSIKQNLRIYCVRVLCLLISVFFSLSCQSITEPDNLVVGDGFRMRVGLQNQAGEPISSAFLEWRILQKAVNATTGTLVGDWVAFNQVATGEFEAVVPVQLSNRDDYVVVRTRYTGSDVALYSASLPFNGRTERFDTVKVCGDVRIQLELSKQSPPVCCGAVSTESLRLTVVAPTFPNDTAASSIMSIDQNCNEQTVSFSASPLSPADANLTVYLRRTATNTLQALPQTVTRGERFQFVAVYTTPLTNTPPAGIQTYSSVITGSAAGNANCITVNLRIQRELTVNARCDCPSVRDTTFYAPTDSTQTIPLCIGVAARLDTVFLPPSKQITNSADSSCTIQISLDRQTVDADISLISFNGSFNTSRVVLLPGQRLTQGPVFSAAATKTGAINADLRYRVQVVDGNGTTKECGFLNFAYRGFGEGSRCVIDSAASTIFKQVNGRFVLDTLQECVSNIIVCRNNNTVAVNNPRTIVIRNAGRCPLTITNPTLSNNKFAVSSNPGVVMPNDTQSFRIAFTPTREDLWFNGQRGSTPTPFHNVALTLGCNLGTMNVIGKADSCPESVGLNLRQYGLQAKYYEGIVIQPARAEKSGDARRLGNGAEIFANLVNSTGGTLDGGTYSKTGVTSVTYKFIASNHNIPGKVCDNYPTQTFGVLDPRVTTGWTQSIPFNNKDVIAFRKETDENGSGCYLYGIIWIQQIDADAANPGAFIVTLDFCYPM
ncbi:MAG: hypothetical protein JNL32_08805 [Candidatus Kapabacteria bacterium]|nr:hypothetical protein [Candidatus Kapabacteria bacterium]